MRSDQAKLRTERLGMNSLDGHVLKQVDKANTLVSRSQQRIYHVSSYLYLDRKNKCYNWIPAHGGISGIAHVISVKIILHSRTLRSTVEYNASVQDPFLKKDTNQLEGVQRRSSRFVVGDFRWTRSVSSMLKDLGLTAIPTEAVLIAADSRTQSNHPYKFKHLATKTTATPSFHTLFPSGITNALRLSCRPLLGQRCLDQSYVQTTHPETIHVGGPHPSV